MRDFVSHFCFNMPKNGNTIIRLDKDTLEPLIERYIKQMENAYYFDDYDVFQLYATRIYHILQFVIHDKEFYKKVIKSNALLRSIDYASKS